MNNVVTRTLSGAVYVALIVAAIYFGEWTFYLLTAALTVLGITEFFKISHSPEGNGGKYLAAQIVDTVFALLIALSTAVLWLVPAYEIMLVWFLVLLSGYVLARAVLSLTDTEPHAYREVAKSVLGVMYIALPMFMLNCLYTIGGESTRWLVLLMFCTIWLNDTGAFCFGITLGKHRLCERLSPKKSWEGFWGGMLCCVVFAAVCSLWINTTDCSVVWWMALGVLISLMSTWGDLFESMLKRTVHVKDSGNLIPGHGGILDRIDSLLFVAPSTLIYYLVTLSW